MSFTVQSWGKEKPRSLFFQSRVFHRLHKQLNSTKSVIALIPLTPVHMNICAAYGGRTV